MPVKIRLSRAGAKKRPYYRVVIADSRRSRDGKFIERIGTFNPMLKKDDPNRVKIDSDKAKLWLKKGAQPTDRIKIFLSNIGIMEKPVITEKTKSHLPKKKEKKEEAKPAAAEVKPEEKKEEAKPAAAEVKPEEKKEEAKPAAAEVKPEEKQEKAESKKEK